MTYKFLAAKNIIAEANATDYFGNEEYRKSKQLLAAMGVGGFCLFKGNYEQTSQMVDELQDIAEGRLIIAADFEYGLPMRITDAGTAFPHAMALGKNTDYMETYKIARLLGRECKALKVDWNFAPVSDINNNLDNPIINIRSFGEDKETVALHSSAFIKGLQDERILACAKHFPGHGDTAIDSHMSLPILDFSRDRLFDLELYPFIKAIENGVKSIMIGHLAVPALDETAVPASLSYDIIQNLLRNELNYQGIVVTDALRMDAISKNYTSGLAAETALRAGNSSALMPESELEAIEHLEEVAKKDAEFVKLLETNEALLEENRLWSKDDSDLRPNQKIEPLHEKIALFSAYKAVNIIEPSNIPLRDIKQFASFAFLQSENDFPKASTFFHLLQQAVDAEMDFGFLDSKIERDDLIELKTGINDAEILIIAYFYKSMESAGSLGEYDKLEPIVTRLAEGRPVISVVFGNPYLMNGYSINDTILTYSDSLASQAAAIMKITGRNLSDLSK